MDADETGNEDTGPDAEAEETAFQWERPDSGYRTDPGDVHSSGSSSSSDIYTPLPVPTRRRQKQSQRRGRRPAPHRRLGRARFALRTHLPCGLSRAVVQEPYSPLNVQIRHRSRVARASYAPHKRSDQGNGPGMMGAGNAGNVGNARNAGGCQFERMSDAVLRLAAGVPVVFVNERLIGFPPCTLWLRAPLRLRLDLHQTGSAPNTESDTIPTNQANQLIPPPPPSGSGSSVNTMVVNRHYIYSRPTTPGPTGAQAPLPCTLFPSSPRPNRCGGQEPATYHANSSSSSGNSSRPKRKKWVYPDDTRCARLSRPRSAKPGCGATSCMWV